MSENGFTPAQISDMTLFDIEDLNRWERDHPPIGRFAAAYFGFKPSRSPADVGEAADLLRQIEAGELRALG